MKYIPFLPLFRLIKIAIKGGGFSLRGLKNLPVWLAKTILLEPLRIIEAIFYEHKINHHVIKQSPVFILGHYRSGTTYLHQLFSKDPRFGWQTLFEEVAPEIMFLAEKPLVPIMQFISDALNARNNYHRIRLKWDFPAEEEVAMMGMLSEHTSYWGFLFPENFIEYYSAYLNFTDQHLKEKWQKDYTWLLKKLSIKNEDKRLVLKSPPNTARIKELLALFPDARFIYLSRDPYELYSSASRLWDVILKYDSLGPCRNIDSSEYIYKGLEIMLDRYFETRHSIPPGQLMEIDYNCLLHQPIPTLESIYHYLKLPDFEYCRPMQQSFANEQNKYEVMQHRLPEAKRSEISKRWSRYIKDYERIKMGNN
jgi:omega-hydroxy-beta-dihydromenaquinone-9 sulfotransferase